jgi:hypothetical protein
MGGDLFWSVQKAARYSRGLSQNGVQQNNKGDIS